MYGVAAATRKKAGAVSWYVGRRGVDLLEVK
jgi:hypothetical protein